MIAALLLSLLAQAPATSPAQANTAAPGLPAANEDRIARFFFYRLQYFHATAAEQGCLRPQPERTRALDARYDALERRIVALTGPVSPYSSPDYRRDGYDDDCRGGIILNGYDLALHTLERHLAEMGR
jgi:hypothetical protein